MPEKQLKHPIPAGPRILVGYKPAKIPGKLGDPIMGARPMKECEHRCVHCGATLEEA